MKQERQAHDELERLVHQRTAELEIANDLLRKQISERIQAELSAKESELRVRALVSSIDDVVFEFDADGAYVNIWTTNEELLPQPREKMIGHRAGKFFGRAFAQLFLEAFPRVLSTGQPESIEYSLDLPTRGRRHFLGRISPVPGAGGAPKTVCLLVRDVTELKQAEASLAQLSARLMQLQDEERRRIARELHDSMAQNLVGIALNLDRVLEKGAQLPSASVECLREALALAMQVANDVRNLSHLLHPPLLDEVGLASAVRWHVDRFTQHTGIKVDLKLPKELRRLPHEHETTLYRIVQEALTNVHRHSGSPTAMVRVTVNTDQLTLEIKDDGAGMPAGVVQGTAKMGVGVRGMRERVKQLGGSLEIKSSKSGTTVKAVLPIAERSRAEDSGGAEDAGRTAGAS